MAAEDILISDNIEAELQPHVVVIANDLTRFESFKSTLDKGGYPATLASAVPTDRPRAGTVFFISFNLRSEDAVAAARHLEQTLKMNCIVFAEEEGTKTATKLSSAKMTQTLQYPYTEKNFVMAMQTIVKKRKAQHEKDLRKKMHDERMRSRQQSGKEAIDLGTVIQEAPEALILNATQVFKGENHAQFTLTQSGPESKNFFAIQEGVAPAPASAREAVTPSRKASEREPAAVTEQRKKITVASEETLAPATTSPRLSLVNEIATEQSQPAVQTGASIEILSKYLAQERTMNEFWIVLGVCAVGAIVVLYCTYLILTNGF